MPIVQITLLEGRTDAQKRAMYREVTDALERTLGAPRESVRIMIHDIPRGDFAVAGISKSVPDQGGTTDLPRAIAGASPGS